MSEDGPVEAKVFGGVGGDFTGISSVLSGGGVLGGNGNGGR